MVVYECLDDTGACVAQLYMEAEGFHELESEPRGALPSSSSLCGTIPSLE